MSDKRKAYIEAVKDAPKESLTVEYVCLNCGNLHHSINAPEKQGCCTVEKYIKNIL
jgi:rubrerythrin